MEIRECSISVCIYPYSLSFIGILECVEVKRLCDGDIIVVSLDGNPVFMTKFIWNVLKPKGYEMAGISQHPPFDFNTFQGTNE